MRGHRPQLRDAIRHPGREPAQRLHELNSLRAMEAITEDEYTEKRRQIISEI